MAGASPWAGVESKVPLKRQRVSSKSKASAGELDFATVKPFTGEVMANNEASEEMTDTPGMAIIGSRSNKSRTGTAKIKSASWGGQTPGDGHICRNSTF